MTRCSSILALLSFVASAFAQEPPNADDELPSPKAVWPRDAQRVVCTIAGKPHTLRDMLAHIDRRHYPGLLEFIDTPAGQLFFDTPYPARWVRQYADAAALELEARSRGVDAATAQAALGASLRHAFEHWLEEYQVERTRRGQPVEMTQDRVNLLLTDFQQKRGLETEVQGWLDLLVPDTDASADRALRGYYEDNPRFFGGRVTIAQILVQHRDPETGELLVGKAKEVAYRKLADVRSRLLPDGSNFEEVARLLSDDRRTAADGGVLRDIERFDPRLPAVICRTAWQLADGEFSEPVESPYGLHIIKRLRYKHLYYVIYTDDLKPQIIATKRRAEQEDLLFGVRSRYSVELRY